MVGQPEGKPQLRITGLNPAHPVLGFCLGNQINSKCHEILGPKNTLGDEYNQGPKVWKWLTFDARPAGQVGEWKRGPPRCVFTPSYQPILLHHAASQQEQCFGAECC